VARWHEQCRRLPPEAAVIAESGRTQAVSTIGPGLCAVGLGDQHGPLRGPGRRHPTWRHRVLAWRNPSWLQPCLPGDWRESPGT